MWFDQPQTQRDIYLCTVSEFSPCHVVGSTVPHHYLRRVTANLMPFQLPYPWNNFKIQQFVNNGWNYIAYILLCMYILVCSIVRLFDCLFVRLILANPLNLEYWNFIIVFFTSVSNNLKKIFFLKEKHIFSDIPYFFSFANYLIT